MNEEERRMMRQLDGEVERLAYDAIGAAIEVHRLLGPGFLEKVYQGSLEVEFRLRGIPCQPQKPVPVKYKGCTVGENVLDFLVGDVLVVELKAVESLTSLHSAQVISYMKVTGCQLGLLINFNVHILKEGIKRIILSS
ncbi:GxxExxY protein [Coleofasciculus sp. FACHB-1120]|uniref:GxxExxY protein n=1 Tax=Coleofasciculus sp. FACHB-1120 TaxID=2692783 RepID=UPI001F556783|nr:GxxExxY protein [Coleofasciculus sp. FACHB-1120]